MKLILSGWNSILWIIFFIKDVARRCNPNSIAQICGFTVFARNWLRGQVAGSGLSFGCGVRSFICSSVTGPLRPDAAVQL